MPKLTPLSLYCPIDTAIACIDLKSIIGPKVFVSLLNEAEDYTQIKTGIENLIQNKLYQQLKTPPIIGILLKINTGVLKGFYKGYYTLQKKSVLVHMKLC